MVREECEQPSRNHHRLARVRPIPPASLPARLAVLGNRGHSRNRSRLDEAQRTISSRGHRPKAIHARLRIASDIQPERSDAFVIQSRHAKSMPLFIRSQFQGSKHNWQAASVSRVTPEGVWANRGLVLFAVDSIICRGNPRRSQRWSTRPRLDSELVSYRNPNVEGPSCQVLAILSVCIFIFLG